MRSDEITIEGCKALNEETLEFFLRMDLDMISRPLESAIDFRSLYMRFRAKVGRFRIIILDKSISVS